MQFTIKPDPEAYTCLLNILAEQNINVRAIAQLGKGHHIIAKFIPNLPGEDQGLGAIIATRNIVEYLCIPYSEQQVIAVTIPNLPGQLAAIQRLFYCRVEVRASYIDENGPQIYELNNVDLAERILADPGAYPPVQTHCLRCHDCDSSSESTSEYTCTESHKDTSTSIECFEVVVDRHPKHQEKHQDKHHKHVVDQHKVKNHNNHTKHHNKHHKKDKSCGCNH